MKQLTTRGHSKKRLLIAGAALGAVDRLELLEFPVLLGDGVPFSLPARHSGR